MEPFPAAERVGEVFGDRQAMDDEGDDSITEMEDFLVSKTRSPLQESCVDDAKNCIENEERCLDVQDQEEKNDAPDFYYAKERSDCLDDVEKQLAGENSSSSTEATAKRQSVQTHPETPPSPMRSESQHSAYSSSTGADAAEDRLPAFVLPVHFPSPGRSHQQQHYQAQASTHHSSYNPLTSHSPSRKIVVRREIMGKSLLSSVQSEQWHQAVRPPIEIVQSEDDSEVALEMAAQLIRLELLHSEMTELADKAERAAEAGVDRFAAKPCVFQDDMEHAIPGGRPFQQMQRRMSEGSRAPAPSSSPRRRSITGRLPASSMIQNLYNPYTKLSVVELRDVNEVFPSFRQFHTHLRTHFFRSEITKEQLLFQEGKAPHENLHAAAPIRPIAFYNKKDSPGIALLPLCTTETIATPLPVRKIFSKATRLDRMQAGFLRTFSLDQWTAPHLSWASTNNDDDDDDDDDLFIGNLLSEHIAADAPPKPRKIEVPPGLEATYASTSSAPLRRAAVNRTRVWDDGNEPGQARSTVKEYTNLHLAHSPPSSLHHCVVEPRALFDAHEYDSADEMDASTRSVDVREPLRSEKAISAGLVRFQSTLSQDQDPSHHTLTGELLPRHPSRLENGLRKRSNSIVAPHDGTSSDPVPSIIPDFITPARLRKIRGFRKVPGEAIVGARNASGLLRTNNSFRRKDPPRRSISLGITSRIPQRDFAARKNAFDVSGDSHIDAEIRDNPIIKDATVRLVDHSSKDQASRACVGQAESSRTFSTIPEFIAKRDCFESLEPLPLNSAVALQLKRSSSPQNPTFEKLDIPSHSASFGVGTRHPRTTASSPKVGNSQEIIQRLHDDFSQALLHVPPSPVSEKEVPACLSQQIPGTDHAFDDLETAGALPSRLGLIKQRNDSVFYPRDPVSTHVAPDINHSRLDRSEGKLHAPVKFRHVEVSCRRHQEDLSVDTPQRNDCDCMAISPNTSRSSIDSDLKKTIERDQQTICRATSTSALQDPSSWNAFVESYGSSKPEGHPGPAKSIRAAMNMISKLSPKSYRDQQRALYTRVKENDDFMNNFLYCSKPSEEGDGHGGGPIPTEPCLDGSMNCGETDTGYCCTSLIDDAFALGVFPPKRRSQSRNLVKLGSSSSASSRRDHHSWLDLASGRFDGALENWTGCGRTESVHLNTSFQAPTLKKSGDPRAMWLDAEDSEKEIVDDDNDEGADPIDVCDEEANGVGLYDIEPMEYPNKSPSRLHPSRHLSFIDEDSESRFYARQFSSEKLHRLGLLDKQR